MKTSKTFLVASLLAAAGFICLVRVRPGPFLPRHDGFIRFALCQYDCRPGDDSRNVLHALEYAGEAIRHGADFVILPEFSFTTIRDVASGTTCSNLLERRDLIAPLRDFTRGNGCYLLFNHPSADSVVTDGPPEERLFNRSFLLGPDGTVCADYRKQVMARVDSACGFSPGESNALIRLPFGTLGVIICKDAVSPERSPALRRADLVVIQFAHLVSWSPAATPRDEALCDSIPEALKSLPRAADQCVGFFRKNMLLVNKTGLEDMYAYLGGSRVMSFDGAILSQADSSSEILYADFPLGKDGRIDPRRPPAIPSSPTARDASTRRKRLRAALLRLAARII